MGEGAVVEEGVKGAGGKGMNTLARRAVVAKEKR